MLTTRCRMCGKEITATNKIQSCGCPNNMIVQTDSITANDLSKVIVVNSEIKKNKSNILSPKDLSFQEERKKRKVKKLNFEVR